ncbi:MAG: hydrolase family protein [Candidatus Saccharibacteria bacterium]|nr:hydrolase family protein [Candidatus Saccharibacteria bacterium]
MPLVARAESCNLIQTGLWQGASYAFGVSMSCTQSVNSSKPYSPQEPPTRNSGLYVALGDSVAAGLGLPVASPADQTCGVSAQAYPSAVAAAFQYPYINAACSGATAGDLVSEQHLPNTSRDIEPQLDTAFANGTPALITITAGANDVYWQYFARNCYTGGTCGDRGDEIAYRSFLTGLRIKYEYVLSDIYSRSNGQPPKVVLTGYYHLASGNCSGQLSNVTPAEESWLDARTDDLNRAIQRTANDYSFAAFAPVSFSGHELCSADSWIQGLNSPAPLHPTARGQQVIAQSVISAVNN